MMPQPRGSDVAKLRTYKQGSCVRFPFRRLVLSMRNLQGKFCPCVGGPHFFLSVYSVSGGPTEVSREGEARKRSKVLYGSGDYGAERLTLQRSFVQIWQISPLSLSLSLSSTKAAFMLPPGEDITIS